jgi:hypothetical protein
MELLWGDYYLFTLISYLICVLLLLLNYHVKVTSKRWFKIAAIVLIIPPLGSARAFAAVYPEANWFIVFFKNYITLLTLLNLVGIVGFGVKSGFNAIGLSKESLNAFAIISFVAIVVFFSSGAYYETFVK